jgi:hypothetical protein
MCRGADVVLTLAMLARRVCVGEPDGFGGHSESPSPELRIILGSKVRDADRPATLEAERVVVRANCSSGHIVIRHASWI